ncbi:MULTISPECIES: hypothetical protein [unclassified Arthrobacter]|uniref:hypothetical protein n=1 Tax=unclassified Arthrobacter TaxID=235627 RepID=UPI001491BFB4|nr:MULTISPECIES: hypothetical protein [unclassified Arthrobacter]NOJ64132.1 hypothetical protein [Arthrobacter sp. 147(2020)]
MRSKRRLGLGVVVLALLLAVVVLFVSCSSTGDLRRTEARLDELPGVNGSYLWTSSDGFPTNRRLSARIYVDSDPGEELAALLDAALETTWSFTGFEPTAGIAFQMVVGKRPAEPVASNWDDRVVLKDVLPEIGLDIDGVGVPSFGDVVHVSPKVMTDRYGPWPGDD